MTIKTSSVAVTFLREAKKLGKPVFNPLDILDSMPGDKASIRQTYLLDAIYYLANQDLLYIHKDWAGAIDRCALKSK